MAPVGLEVVFILPDSRRLTFRTHFCILSNPQSWRILVGAMIEEIYRKSSIVLFSSFREYLSDFSRRANDPYFAGAEASVAFIEVQIERSHVVGKEDTSDDDDNGSIDGSVDGDSDTDDGDSDASTDGCVDGDSDMDEEEQRAELPDQVVLNQAMERSFQESQDRVWSFGGVPASKEALENLTYFTAEEGDGASAADAVCTICLEEMLQAEQVCRIPCSHLFHGGCLHGWLKVSGLCPLCRFKL